MHPRHALLLMLLALAACTPAPATFAPGEPLPPVLADGARLTAGGRPLEVRGVNFVRVTGADPARCWTFQFGADPRCPWDQQAIEADLDRYQARGINTVRVFLNYYVFGGQRKEDETYDKTGALAHLDAFIAAANARGMYVLPVLLIEYPQDRFGPEHHERALDLHVRPVVRHLAGRNGILAWDLFNEPDIGSPIDERCWDWDNADFPLCFPLAEERMRFLAVVAAEVEQLDPGKLTTIGMAFAKSFFEPAEAERRVADMVDFYTFHYYDDAPYNSGRYQQHWYYGQGFPEDLRRAIRELHALGLEKPVVVTELGFPSGEGETRTPDDLRRDLRRAWELAREENAAGIVLWSFQATPEELLGDTFTRE
jgi:endo-1,4-beta-mannosidase